MEEKGQEREPRMVQTTVAVEGMTCGACTSAIEGMSYRKGRRREGEGETDREWTPLDRRVQEPRWRNVVHGLADHGASGRGT